MNKEKILELSRKEKNDEGMIAAENRGRKIGMSVLCCVYLFIILFNFFNGQSNYALMALFCAFMAAESFPKYQFTKNKAYLITTIAGTLAAILYLANLVKWTLR